MTETHYTLDDVLDEVSYLKTRRLGDSGVILAVWHGGHTVNAYTYDPADPDETIRPADTRSVGDYETGETTRDDAREAMLDMLTMEHERV